MALQKLITIKNWFKTGLKPTQNQFWDTWDSFWHKGEKIPVAAVEGIDELLQTKASKVLLDRHIDDDNAHAGLFATKEVTYNDLISMKNTDSLVAGTFYSFDHYHQNFYNATGGHYVHNDPTPERLVAQALSNSVLSEHVRSIAFPGDEVEYKFEGGSNPTGIVIKRVDKQRNITMYLDWRKAKFWNYKTSDLVNVLYGDDKLYTNIYIGRDFGYGIPKSFPIIFNSYSSINVHISQIRSPLYIGDARNVRIDSYIAEYDTKAFVSMYNVQVNSLYINMHSDVLNEILIDNVVGCVANIDNNTSVSITVGEQINPTITIKGND
jgi:hypothetical protein